MQQRKTLSFSDKVEVIIVVCIHVGCSHFLSPNYVFCYYKPLFQICQEYRQKLIFSLPDTLSKAFCLQNVHFYPKKSSGQMSAAFTAIIYQNYVFCNTVHTCIHKPPNVFLRPFSNEAQSFRRCQ